MVKTYEFSYQGLQQAFYDNKVEKINRYVNIGFWIFMLLLCKYGSISINGLIKMYACSSTSRIVKYMMN